MKILLIIIDGLGDKPIVELNNRTPLDAAKTPNLDFLAKNGICGLAQPLQFSWEKEPSSEGAHIGLFGYKNYFLGRGPYEAAGIGIKLKKGDIALRVNFGTVDENLKIIDRRAGRIEKTQSLIKALQGIEIESVYPVKSAEGGAVKPQFNRVKFLLKKSYGHRATLILQGQNLSADITSNDPKKIESKPLRVTAKNSSKKAKFTAKVLNQFLEKSHQILKNHSLNKRRKKQGLLQANYLLVRGAGMFKKTPSFKEKYGLKAACVAGGGLYKGVAKILGMDLINVKGATGFANTNLKGKFSASKNALKKYDFVFCHIKATDTFSHDGDFSGKKKFIEKIDKNLKSILSLNNALIVITADHSTCCDLKKHCAKPVPVLIFGNGKDAVDKFSEKACEKGKLGRIKASDLMAKILFYKK